VLCTTPQSAQIGLMCNNDITQFYLPPTHEPYLPLIPSRKASPPLGWYQLVLLGEQRHIGVRNMPRVFTPCARLRLEPTTSWSQVQQSTDGATTPPKHPCVCCCTRYPQIVIDTVQPKLLFCKPLHYHCPFSSCYENVWNITVSRHQNVSIDKPTCNESGSSRL